jgi:hypothetical protein
MRGTEDAGRAAHVLLHDQHRRVGLDVEPAGIEAHPLADQRDLRRGRIAPADVDQARRACRRAADRVDEREISQQFFAGDRRDAPSVPCGEVTRRLLQLGRPEIVRRRIDEVARERHARGDARELGAVDAVGNRQLCPVRLGLAVAGELVGAEREGERRKPRVVRRIGKAPGAGRQQQRQAARQEAVLVGLGGRLQAEQGAVQGAVRAGEQQELAGLWLELRRLGEPSRRRSKLLAHLRIVVGGDEPDRNRRGPGRNEGRMHEKSPKGALLPRRLEHGKA